MSKEEIKKELTKYEPTPEERTVIRGAVFNFISLGTSRPIASSLYTCLTLVTATAGAGSLGLSGYLWSM